jgi:hypothetical protein
MNIERDSGNSPVFTTEVERARKAPASPAAPALIAKASTLVRGTCMPEIEAAISSSRCLRGDERADHGQRQLEDRTGEDCDSQAAGLFFSRDCQIYTPTRSI